MVASFLIWGDEAQNSPAPAAARGKKEARSMASLSSRSFGGLLLALLVDPGVDQVGLEPVDDLLESPEGLRVKLPAFADQSDGDAGSL